MDEPERRRVIRLAPLHSSVFQLASFFLPSKTLFIFLGILLGWFQTIM